MWLYRGTIPSLVLVVLCLSGCRQQDSDSGADVKLDFALQPVPPKVGPALVTIKLAGRDGALIQGASVLLEGNMNHAGMKPVFGKAREVSPGHYEATLELTMGGDWFVLIQGTQADGRKFRHKVDVPGVRSR